MKTLKLMMIAVFATLTMVSFAQLTLKKSDPAFHHRSGPVNDVKGVAIIKLSLAEAVAIPELSMAMAGQIDLGTLHSKKSDRISIEFRLENRCYVVSGSFEEYLRWFRLRVVKMKTENKIID